MNENHCVTAVKTLRETLLKEGSMNEQQIEQYISEQDEIFLDCNGDVKVRQFICNDAFEDLVKKAEDRNSSQASQENKREIRRNLQKTSRRKNRRN